MHHQQANGSLQCGRFVVANLLQVEPLTHVGMHAAARGYVYTKLVRSQLTRVPQFHDLPLLSRHVEHSICTTLGNFRGTRQGDYTLDLITYVLENVYNVECYDHTLTTQWDETITFDGLVPWSNNHRGVLQESTHWISLAHVIGVILHVGMIDYEHGHFLCARWTNEGWEVHDSLSELPFQVPAHSTIINVVEQASQNGAWQYVPGSLDNVTIVCRRQQ